VARLEAPSPACDTCADALISICCATFRRPAGGRFRLRRGLVAAPVDIVDDQGQALPCQTRRRIVSLAPHITELLYAAGAGDKVVGAVQYSDYPEAAKMPRVGGYTSVDMEKVWPSSPTWWWPGRAATVTPTWTSCALGIPVFINEPRKIDDVAKSLAQFGRLAGTEAAGEAAAKAFRERHAALAPVFGAAPACAPSTRSGTAR
jgi:iron complex transport system substrate-binding protein